MKKKLVTEPRELVLLLFVMTSTLIYKGGDERRRYVFFDESESKIPMISSKKTDVFVLLYRGVLLRS